MRKDAAFHEVNFAQEPGSFYVGNLCALGHNVHHHAECLHTFRTKAATASARTKAATASAAATSSGSLEDWQADEAAAATADSGLQIAVMIRSDVFRNARARKIKSTPGPTDFFRVVNRAVAQHLAECPVRLPDLTAVLAEASRVGDDGGGVTD